MIKKTLSITTVAAFLAFSGCSAVTDNPVTNVAKSATGSVVDSAKGTASSVAGAASSTAGATSGLVGDATDVVTGKSSLTDKATDKAVEIADEKTDGKASQVLDAIK